jgi:hypothetical protein
MSVLVICMKKISMVDALYEIDVCACNLYKKISIADDLYKINVCG